MSVVQSAILKHLQADTDVTALVSTRIYPSLAPEGAAFPYVIVSALTNQSADLTYGATIASEQGRWIVKAVDQSASPATASTIAEALKTSLHNAALTITGTTCQGCLYVAAIPPYIEREPGKTYQHAGCVFEVMIADEN